jgi:predicted nucleotidyltransferase
MSSADLYGPIRCLCERRVEFIVVGGLAAVLNGAPVHTYDVDVVFLREPGNIERILSALEDMDAIFRMQLDRRLRPNQSHVSAGGHLLLHTRFGPFDLLGTIGEGLAYDDLLSQSTEMDIGQGLRVRVLNLETIIAIKEQLRRDKDVAVLAILRQTLNEIRRQAATPSSGSTSPTPR